MSRVEHHLVERLLLSVILGIVALVVNLLRNRSVEGASGVDKAALLLISFSWS
jgi:hypothetical protein